MTDEFVKKNLGPAIMAIVVIAIIAALFGLISSAVDEFRGEHVTAEIISIHDHAFYSETCLKLSDGNYVTRKGVLGSPGAKVEIWVNRSVKP